MDQDGDTIDILVQRRRNNKPPSASFATCSKAKAENLAGSVQINDTVRMLPTARSCRPSNPLITSMPTTKPKCRINQHGNENITCAVFPHHNRLNGFLTLHGFTQNLFRLGRPLMRAVNYRLMRSQSFKIWESISKRGQLGRLGGWPIPRCTTERGVPAIEHTSQIVIEHARPDL